MLIQGLKRLMTITAITVLATGCAATPGVGQTASQDPGLLNRILGSRTQTRPAAPVDSGVVQASATEPIGQGSDPNVVPATGTPTTVAPYPVKEEESGFKLSDLSPDNLDSTVKKMAGYGPNKGVAEALLKEGESFFEAKDYGKAASRFKSAAGRWPDSSLQEDAMFMRAECYFFSDKYPKAQDLYEETLKKYENSRHLDTICKRLFAIGQYWEKTLDDASAWSVAPNLTDKTRPGFDTFGNAIKAYEMIRLFDPIGPLSDDAVMATANAYFKKGSWDDAAFHYDILRKEYPRSEHQARAHIFAIQANLKRYQGDQYEGSPLETAEEIAKQALMQFPGELGDERQRVEKARLQIMELKAQRDWAMAQYWDKKACYGAARHYYQNVIDEYAGTSFAKRSAGRLAEIRDKPAEPPQRFQWINKLFPSND